MNTQIKAGLSALALAALAACGGGGGGGSASAPVASTPTAVQITETNAKPVAAHATATAQDSSAQSSSSLVAGVQVEGGAEPTPNLQAIASLARLGAEAAGGPSMAAGVTTDRTVSCAGGGSIHVSGSVSGSGLTAGDTVTVDANSCTETVSGVATTMNGSLTFSVASGSISGSTTTPYPFNVVLTMTARSLSVKSSSQTSTINGDMQLSLSQTTAANGSITASGSTLTSSLTTASGTRSTTLRNYSQTETTNGTAVTGTMSATVESTSSLLGGGGSTFTYTISTPTALQWTTSNPNPTAGVVKVVGAGNSQLLVTYSAGSVVLSIDANGDGTFEKTVTTTAADLKALL